MRGEKSMKTTFIAALTTATMLTSAAYAANAPDGFFFKPYVGAAYDYVHANYRSQNGISGSDIASDSLNGADFHVGARIHKYFGIEGSYLWTADASKNNVLGTNINTKVNVRGFALDGMGYLPIDGAGKFELIGTIGVSRLTGGLSLSGSATGSGHESEIKGRFGGGAQYWLTDNLNVRGLVRYQGADFSGDLNNAIITGLGLNWQF